MAAKVESTTLWATNQDDPIIGVSSAKNGFIITARSSIRKQTVCTFQEGKKEREWEMRVEKG
jgi:hypothetical protein